MVRVDMVRLWRNWRTLVLDVASYLTRSWKFNGYVVSPSEAGFNGRCYRRSRRLLRSHRILLSTTLNSDYIWRVEQGGSDFWTEKQWRIWDFQGQPREPTRPKAWKVESGRWGLEKGLRAPPAAAEFLRKLLWSPTAGCRAKPPLPEDFCRAMVCVWCPSVSLSVRLPVCLTILCILSKQIDIFKKLSPSGSHTIL